MGALNTDNLKGYRQTVAERITDLQRQIEPLTKELGQARAELSAIETLLAAQDPTFKPSDSGDGSPGVSSVQHSDSVAEVAFAALEAAGHPLHYRDLYQAMVNRGAKVRGKNPAANVISHINVDPRFTRVSRGTYALTKWGDNV